MYTVKEPHTKASTFIETLYFLNAASINEHDLVLVSELSVGLCDSTDHQHTRRIKKRQVELTVKTFRKVSLPALNSHQCDMQYLHQLQHNSNISNVE